MSALSRSLSLLVVVASMLGLVACGDDDVVTQGSTTAVAPADDSSGVGSLGPDDLVVEVATVGGLVPVETAVTRIPDLVVLGDGTAITPGAQIEIFPPPALPAVDAVTLGGVEVTAILDLVADSGLFGAPTPEFGTPPVADVPDTRISARVGDEVRVVSIPALGFDDGVTVEQAAARERAAELLDQIRALVAARADESAAWTPTGWLLGVRPYADAANEELPREPVDWPLEPAVLADAATGERPFGCLAVSGDDAEILTSAASGADQLTPWAADGEEYQVLFRPWLPHESGCVG